MTKRYAALLMGGSAITILAAAAPAFAQAPAAPSTTLQEIVVTGTSIRGVAPVGASVVSVGQDAIQKTASQSVQQILQSVPAVVGLGSAGQGAFGSADGAGVDAPTIHGLGASASNSTLILIDGHRIPLAGLNHALGDPNVIPPLAIQRVEVLADGASSIYGSDAVAGVINFITRKNYNGFEVSGQAGFASHYRTYQAGFIGGKTWEGGSGLLAYSYSDRSALLAGDRSFTHANHLSQGGTNQASLSCGQATVIIGSQAYYAPYTQGGVTTPTVGGPCDFTGLADLLPAERRNNVMAKGTQQINDKLTVSADVVYSNLIDVSRVTRGAVTATIFGPGSANTSQINPYFLLPAGAPAGTTSESIRWDADSLFGPGAKTTAGLETFYVNGSAEYKLFGDWRATAGGVIGINTSRSQTVGTLNSSAATLALNGTTNGGGSLTTPSVPATGLIVTQTLTAANALNPFVISGNPTSASVLAGLLDNTTTQVSRHNLQDFTIKLDGSAFNLPAGPVKLAVGGEYMHYTLHQDLTRVLGIGPASTGSGTTNLDYNRTVMSAYGEVLVPVVAAEQNIPFVRRFDLTVSGRYDHYSDFGNTSNPKFGANWEVLSGFKLRADYAKSFVAPALTSIGIPTGPWGITGESSVAGGGTATIPIAAYPTAAGALPGCAATAVTCTVGGSVQGLQINGGNKDLKPQLGTSWSVGADFNPSFIPGLRTSLTYWHDQIQGAITAPTMALAVNSPGLQNLLTIYPAGATQAQISAATQGLPLTTTIPAKVYYIYSFQQRNALNLWIEGIDYDISYAINTHVGRITLQTGGSYKTKFDQQFGSGKIFNVLNTSGFNTTFPSIQFQARSSIGWDSQWGLSGTVFWNHTSSYKYWGPVTVNPITKDLSGYPTGGGDTVNGTDIFDLHVAYDFQGKGWQQGAQVFLDVQNLADRAPSFANTGSGYDTFSGNPIGRVITIGARKKF